MSTTVKIQCAVTPDFHVRKIKVTNLGELKVLVSQWFTPVIEDLKPDQLIFDYIDEDGDEVRVDSETEWKDLCNNNTEPGKPVRIRVRRLGFDHFNGVPLPLPVAGNTQTNFDFTRGSMAAFVPPPYNNNSSGNLSGSTSCSNYPSPNQNNNNNNNGEIGRISTAPPFPEDRKPQQQETSSETTTPPKKSESVLQKERDLRLVVEDDAEERKKLAQAEEERRKKKEEEEAKRQEAANEELKKELERQEQQRLRKEEEQAMFEKAKKLAIEKKAAEEKEKKAAAEEEEKEKKRIADEKEKAAILAAKKAEFIEKQKEIEKQIEADLKEKNNKTTTTAPPAVSTDNNNNNNETTPKRHLAKDLRPAYREALPLLSNLYKVSAEETILKMMGGAFRGAIRIQANLATSEINFVINDAVLHEHVALRLQELLNMNERPMACHIANDFVRLYPESSTGRYNYAVVLTKAEQFDTALAELQHAVYLGANAGESRRDTDLAPLRKFMAFRLLGVEDDEEGKKVTPLMEMFPEMTFEQASKLTKKHKNNLEAAANEYLGNMAAPNTTTVGPRASPW